MLSILDRETVVVMIMTRVNKHSVAMSCCRQLTWVLLTVTALPSFPVGADEAAASGGVPASHANLVELNKLSRQLISEVKTGTANATEFRTHVVFYRESLRDLMLADENNTQHRIANSLLMQMVQMAALLQSAAECQTGRYITCPANLLTELDRQQQQLNVALTSVPNATASP